MGYYTNYNLQYVDLRPEENRPEPNCKKLDLIDFEDEQRCKWYEHNNDLLRASLITSDTVFILDGRGEEGEVWRKFFLNGAMYEWYAEEPKPPQLNDILAKLMDQKKMITLDEDDYADLI